MTQSCSTHTTDTEGCTICDRMRIERDITTQVVDGLLEDGYALHILEDDPRPSEPTTDRAVILAELMETDDDRLLATKTKDDGTVKTGWVWLVYGNDGYDVICDYTLSLEKIIDPICDAAMERESL